MHQINLSNGTICNWSSINNSSLLLIFGNVISLKSNQLIGLIFVNREGSTEKVSTNNQQRDVILKIVAKHERVLKLSN